jgi:hypothetical protein
VALPLPSEEVEKAGWDWLGLLKTWISLGLSEDDFWQKTPRQTAIIIKGKNAQLAREHNARAWHAHTVAALQRTKRMPSLRKLLVRDKDQKPQHWQDMKAIAKQWTVVLGGEIKAKTD